MNNNEFGFRLQELRKGSKLSQGELAVKLNCSTSSISKYELGIRTPDILFLDRAADFFDVSVDYLLGRSHAKTNETDIKVICDYLGLSERAIEELKKISSIFTSYNGLFNYLCETKGITNIVCSITHYGILHHIIVNLAKIISLKKTNGENYTEELEAIKKRKQDFEYFRIEVSHIIDEVLDNTLNSFVFEKIGIDKTEYNNLLILVHDLTRFKGKYLDIDFDELFRDW